jgi:hypothetical protein
MVQLGLCHVDGVDYDDPIWIHINTDLDTPTEYRYLIFDDGLNGTLVLDPAATLEWTVRTFNNIIIYAEARNGTAPACALTAFEVSVNGDSVAVAFINAHNSASGLTMNIAQQEVINNTVQRLRGIGTTFSSDLLTRLIATNSEIYPFCPVSNSVANINSYAIDLIEPAIPATWIGFLPSDISVNGVVGGSTKRLQTKRSTNDFDADSLGFDFKYNLLSTTNAMIAFAAGNSVMQLNIKAFRLNSATVINGTSPIGFYSMNKHLSTTVQLLIDNTLAYTGTPATAARTADIATWFNLSTGSNPFTGRLSMLSFRCGFTPQELSDWYEVWNYYNSNIITGGR